MQPSGRKALLNAFDRLFDRAASKLKLECSPAEKEEVKRRFAERFSEALELIEDAGLREIPEAALDRMEAAIDELSPAHIAAYLAAGPLVSHVQEFLRHAALQAAEQRLLEHWIEQAEAPYGGN